MTTHPTTTNQEQTQRIVRGYHDAWTAGEVDAAGAYLADAIANPAPFNHFSPTRSAAPTTWRSCASFAGGSRMWT